MDHVIVAVRQTVRSDKHVLLVTESGNKLVALRGKEFLHAFDIADVTPVRIHFAEKALAGEKQFRAERYGFVNLPAQMLRTMDGASKTPAVSQTFV